MNDSEITVLVDELIREFESDLSIQYKAPIAIGSSHSLNIESNTCIGTISVWANGAIDWHIFDIVTSTEALLGCREIENADDIRGAIVTVLHDVRLRDGIV